jgi:hypothetical protein
MAAVELAGRSLDSLLGSLVPVGVGLVLWVACTVAERAWELAAEEVDGKELAAEVGEVRMSAWVSVAVVEGEEAGS